MQIIPNERNNVLGKAEVIIKIASIISTISLISFVINKILVESLLPGFSLNLIKSNTTINIFEMLKENNFNKSNNFSTIQFCESVMDIHDILGAKVDLENYERDKKYTDDFTVIILISSSTLFGVFLIRMKIRWYNYFQTFTLIVCSLISICVFIKLVLSFSLFLKTCHFCDFFEILVSSLCPKKEISDLITNLTNVFLPKIKRINYYVLLNILSDFTNLISVLHLLKIMLIFNLHGNSLNTSAEESESLQPIEMQIRQEDDLLYKIKNVNI
jgi:hypothetical protein